MDRDGGIPVKEQFMVYDPRWKPTLPGAITVTVPGAVGSEQIIDGAVTTPKVAESAVTTEKIKDRTITGEDIANSAIQKIHLANNSVGYLEIIDGSVTTPKIVTGAVTNEKIADGTIQGPKIKDGTITPAKLDPAITVLVPDGSIETAKLANDAVTAVKLADGAVNAAAKLGASVVTAVKLAPDAVETAKIKDAQVTLAKLSFTPLRIKAGTYTGDGTESLAITGVGFQPKFLIIYPRVLLGSLRGPYMKGEGDAALAAIVESDSTKYEETAIISLDADGFTVGNYGGVDGINVDDQAYTYIAFG